MIIKIICNDALIEVIGEPFAIDGLEEQFCAHRSESLERCKYTASHCKTGHRIAVGETINGTIENAKKRWATMSADNIKFCLNEAAKVRARFENV